MVFIASGCHRNDVGYTIEIAQWGATCSNSTYHIGEVFLRSSLGGMERIEKGKKRATGRSDRKPSPKEAPGNEKRSRETFRANIKRASSENITKFTPASSRHRASTNQTGIERSLRALQTLYCFCSFLGSLCRRGVIYVFMFFIVTSRKS
jgi:hypothetical protein